MTTFRLETSADILWKTEIDNMGDLILSANGVFVMYVSSATGKLHRIEVRDEDAHKIEGLSLDICGSIRIA